jgi:DNA ligase (NAD+)
MYYILYNPLSSNGSGKKHVARIEELLKSENKEYEVIDLVEANKDVMGHASKIHRTDTLIIVGGDGTLHRFVNAIKGIQNNSEVYLYRGGTGNDFSRDFPKQMLINITENLKNLPSVTIGGKEELFLNGCGFDVSPHMICDPNRSDMSTQEQIECATAFFDRGEYINPTDGWCFEFEDLEYGESLGSTGHHDRRLYALKPAVEEYETVLRDVEWTLGKTGQLTPTAIFDPTEIDNTIITKASVHNLSVMKSLGLKIGGKCFIHKANMIIPQVLRCEDGDSAIEIPKCCPVCGGKTEVVKENESEVLMCKNPNCSGKLLGRLKFFVSKPAVNIDGLSEATLDFLITERWVKKFKDIYHLEDHRYEWEQFDGFGEKSVDKILKSIEASRNVTCVNFITALSIDGVGKSAAKTISDAFNGDFYEFIEAFDSGFDWTTLTDIGDKTAQNINEYLTENHVEIWELAQEFDFIVPTKVEIIDNPLNGLKFCITGSFLQNRDSLKEQLEAKGAKFASSVSKNLDVLFCGDKAGSKLTKAQSLGVKIIYEDELMKMLEG